MPGIRIATVVVAYNDGFVLVGRSMREIEPREDRALQIAGFGLFAACGAAAVVALFSASKLRGLTRAARRRRRISGQDGSEATAE